MAANICCSIELEPKTLNQGQLNRAREVAADVAQKMEPNEGSTIFIEGSRPLEVAVKDVERYMEEGKQLQKAVECEEKAHDIIELPSLCSCTTTNVESPDQVRLKEPLSAPF